MKEELKQLAVEIRKEKYECRENQRKGRKCDFGYRNLSSVYRHKHIAYCLLRGRTMQQIENKNRKNNEPSQYEIKKYMELYREEAIHIDKV